MSRWIWLAIALQLTAPLSAPAAEHSESRARLYDLFDRIWSWNLDEFPEFATHIGAPGRDDRWTDASLEAIERRRRDQRQFLAEIEAIDAAELDAEARLDRDLIRNGLVRTVEGFEFPSEYLAINQLDGVHLEAPQLLVSMRASSLEDFENRLARLRALPARIEQTRALLERGLAAGITPPRVALRDVPQQVRNLITEQPSDSPLMESFAEMPEAIPELTRERLRHDAEWILIERVYPALRGLLEFLERTYLPGARETIGLSALPNGHRWYAHNARHHTTTSATPKQIHEIGLAEVARIRAEMDAVLRELAFDGGFAEFGEFLRTDPRFRFESEDALINAYRAICKRADPELVRLFGTLPRLPYGVKPVPDYMSRSAPTAYYEPGSLEAGRPAAFFANTYALETRPSWEMEALALHEAVPGHHLQISIAQELEGVHDLIKYDFYTAFVEGWALYAESLGAEMGFYRDPYSKFGRLTYEIWRAIRLVVDTGLHELGWSRERAIDFFRQNAPKAEHDIVVEVDRYIVWPGQALAYKMGELEIQKLRERARRRLGSAFDLRAFHDAVLHRGAIPLEILEQRIDAWIEREAAREPTPAVRLYGHTSQIGN